MEFLDTYVTNGMALTQLLILGAVLFNYGKTLDRLIKQVDEQAEHCRRLERQINR